MTKKWTLEKQVRLDYAFAAAFVGIWALVFCSGALLGSDRMLDFSFVALIGGLACLQGASVRSALLTHMRETENGEEP